MVAVSSAAGAVECAVAMQQAFDLTGRTALVIGDVQGHDTHAAAVMGQLRIVLRAYAAEGHTPATVMARASVFLHELDTDRFATRR